VAIGVVPADPSRHGLRVANMMGRSNLDVWVPSVFNHEPSDYPCPFCRLVAGGDNQQINTQQDIVRRDRLATAFVSPRWWPRNHGHVLVVPDAHHENLYDLPSVYGHAVHDLVREMATAIRATYGCDGTSVRQHNKPAGNQDVWHYHVHVFPRYVDDELYATTPHAAFRTPAERRRYVDKLRGYFTADTSTRQA
jgi:histidine triad (HIT) family protein